MKYTTSLLLFFMIIGFIPNQIYGVDINPLVIDSPNAEREYTFTDYHWMLSPKSVDGNGPANITLTLSFCFQCGSWKLLYRQNSLPDINDLTVNDDYAGGPNTGTEVSPVDDIYFNIWYDPNQNVTHYIVLHFEYFDCEYEIRALNISFQKIDQTILPYPIPGDNGDLYTSRDGGTIELTFFIANDSVTPVEQLLYRPYMQRSFLGLSSDPDWCNWEEVPDIPWTANIQTFTIKVNSLDDVILTVVVKSPLTNRTTYYDRNHVPYSREAGIIRVAGEVFISLMIIIPILLLYSGYARTYGLKFLSFQFISMEYNSEDMNPQNVSITKPELSPRPGEDDQVKLENDNESDSENDQEKHKRSFKPEVTLSPFHSDTEATTPNSPDIDPNNPAAAPKAPTFDPSKDVSIKKASRYLTILISLQSVLTVITVITSLAARARYDLDMIFAAFLLPIYIIGIVATNQFDRDRILGYMVIILWFTGVLITRMLFEMNFGDRAGAHIFFNSGIFPEDNYDERLTFVAIFIQVLICISVISMISSLSSASFLFIKNSAILDPRIRQITTIQRSMMLLSIFNVIFALIWVTIILHEIPNFGYTIPWLDFFRLWAEVQISLSLALLSLFCAFAALYHNITFGVIAIISVFSELVFSIYMISVDKNVSNLYDQIEDSYWVATMGIRIITIIIEIIMLITTVTFLGRIGSSALYYKLKHVVNNYSRGYTVAYFSTLFHVVIFTPIVTVIGIAFIASKIIGPEYTFPSLSFAYYWFILSCPAAVISETHRSIAYLIYSILIDAVGLFTLYNVLVPGPWVIFAILPVLKIICAVVSSSVSCCCPSPPSSLLVILPNRESIDRPDGLNQPSNLDKHLPEKYELQENEKDSQSEIEISKSSSSD